MSWPRSKRRAAAIEAGRAARNCATSCRPAARAMRSIAPCGNWRRRGRGGRCGSWPGCRLPSRLLTTFTLGADTPGRDGGQGARAMRQARSIKIKLTGELELDIARVAAVRAARPDAWLGRRRQPGLRQRGARPAGRRAARRSGSHLLEQPLARGREADLEGFARRSRSPATKACCRSPTSPARRAASTWSTSSSTSAAA